MSDHSKIEWTNATWNPITGCSVVSAGCKNCYAMKLAGTRLQHHPSRSGLTVETSNGPVWNGEVRFNQEWLDQPLRWKTPRMIFVCAHGDLFHESVPDEWIDQVFGVMAMAPQHTFQVLTKRAARMRKYLSDLITLSFFEPNTGAKTREEQYHRGQKIGMYLRGCGSDILWSTREERDKQTALGGEMQFLRQHWPLPNVWLGISVENQEAADERIPLLLQTPAALRWISAEPLLGPVDLSIAWHGENALDSECWGDCAWCSNGLPPLHNCYRGNQAEGECSKGRSGLDWVVVGGESGKNARPMHPDWARSLRDQCQAAGVPFFFKQWGEWKPISEGENDWHDMLYKPNRVARDHENQEALDDIYGRTCTVATGMVHINGTLHNITDIGAFQAGTKAMQTFKVGKKAAGRMLDGILHHAYPEEA